jgi:exoribonuclease R
MASLIEQTLYDMNGKVIRPMIPESYSENTCSLLPGKQLYGISLQFIWDGETIKNINWFESTFVTNKSYSYEEFEEEDTPYKNILKEITKYLIGKEVNDSHKWVEEMMIFYNMEAGKLLKESKMGILRRHSEPKKEQLEKYRTFLPEWEKLAFSSAEYCLAEEKDTYHYGLDCDYYCHTTSPIRRYSDLVNQRVIKSILSKTQYIVPIAMYDLNRREKVNKQYVRDMYFLNAISSGNTIFKGIIMEKKKKENDILKIKLYIPEWKRMISTKYKYISDNIVLSRDEKEEIDVTDFKEVQIECAFQLQMRNWKERVIIHLSNI